MVRQTIKLFTITAFFLAGTSSCYYDNLQDLTGNTSCDTSGVTYTNTVQTVMTQNCTSCHNTSSPSGGIDLSTYAALSAVAGDANFIGSIKQISPYSAMPQGASKLDDCTISKLEAWISAGKPQ